MVPAGLLLFFLSFLNSLPASAHVPHDDIFSVAISPTYREDHTVFINVRRNLFRSTDGGASWERLVKGLDNKGFLSGLAISSQTRDILYAGTLGDGVYKSGDGGDSWSRMSEGLEDRHIEGLAVSPRSDDLVFARSREGGLYRTSDGGMTWQEAMPKDRKVTAVGFFPSSRSWAMAGTKEGVLYISPDSGKTWEKKAELRDAGAVTVIACSPDFSSDRTCFAGTDKAGLLKTTDGGLTFQGPAQGLTDKSVRDIKFFPTRGPVPGLIASTRDEGVFLSFDYGSSWQKSSAGLTRDFQAENPDLIQEKGLTGPRPHFSEIAVSDGFAQDGTLFLGGFNGLFRSTDGGLIWKELKTYGEDLVVGIAVSSGNVRAPGIAAATYARGAFLSNDGGRQWKWISKEFKYVMRQWQAFSKGPPQKIQRVICARIYDAAFAPDKTLYFSLAWSPFFTVVHYGSGVLQRTYVPGGGQSAVAFSPEFSKDGTLYLAGQSREVYVSKDKGASFERTGKVHEGKAHDSISFVLSPAFMTDRTMYFADAEGVYLSVDGGTSWEALAPGTALEGGSDFSLAISPDYANDRTLVAGTDAGVFITLDTGKNWSKVGKGTPVENGFIEAVAISPDYKSDRTILVSVRGKGLFKSQDAGASFRHVGDDAISLSRVNAPSASMPIQFSPNYAVDRTVYGYGSASAEIFKSPDGGKTWRALRLPEIRESFPDTLYDLWLVAKMYANAIKEDIKARLAALIVEAGKLKRKLTGDNSPPRQWRKLQYGQ